MKTAVFSTKPYDRKSLESANAKHGHEFTFFEASLDENTAPLAKDFPAVCIFVNDEASANVLKILAEGGTKIIALRCAGYNNVELNTARELGLCVARVPAYSPFAVAEHTVGLMLALNRKIHRAHWRVRDGNFALEGLLGFDMHRRTAGIIGTGKIGAVTAGILKGFGCKLLAYDPMKNLELEESGVRYTELEELLSLSDIITLHCPLMPQTQHIINADTIAKMKPGAMLINTSRGGLIDTPAAIEGLKSGQIGYLGLDVYEEEAELFFEDLSNTVIQDDVFSRLQTFPNVIITGHQAYFTSDALDNIANTTLNNISAFANNSTCQNSVLG